MTNRDRLIEVLLGTVPDAVYRHVLLEQINCPYLHKNKGLCLEEGGYEWVTDEMCIACIENWLSQELELEMELTALPDIKSWQSSQEKILFNRKEEDTASSHD